ncbi:MAG: carbohydrate ABC transporter substrate-binding protein [Ruminococcus sp.]|nr:carbohydrate ABC transporter substrate-binding protein [Ruminococcus sp.]
MKALGRVIASAAAAAMLMQCGCAGKQIVRSQKEQTVISLAWWGNDPRTEYTLKAVRVFEELHPDIKVKCNYSEWSGYEARNRIRMVSETETDVMQINVGWLDDFSKDGTGYYDLNEVSDVLDLTNFPEDTLKYGTRNGVLNAIPVAMNTETVYINKTIFEEHGLGVPQTWDDMFAAADVLSKDGIYPLCGASKAIWLYSIAYTEQKTGRTFFDKNGAIAFTPDELKVMIEFYNEMVDRKVIPKIEDFKKVNVENGTCAGAVAWVSDAINYFGKPIERGEEVIAADYTAFSPADSGAGWYEKPATLYAMSKNTAHPKEAAQLLDFLLNNKKMALLQGVEKGIPISKSAKDYLDEAGQLSGLQYEASIVMDDNANLREMSPLIENIDLINGFNYAANLVLYDKATAEEAAQQLYDTYAESFDMAGVD